MKSIPGHLAAWKRAAAVARHRRLRQLHGLQLATKPPMSTMEDEIRHEVRSGSPNSSQEMQRAEAPRRRRPTDRAEPTPSVVRAKPRRTPPVEHDDRHDDAADLRRRRSAPAERRGRRVLCPHPRCRRGLRGHRRTRPGAVRPSTKHRDHSRRPTRWADERVLVTKEASTQVWRSCPPPTSGSKSACS